MLHGPKLSLTTRSRLSTDFRNQPAFETDRLRRIECRRTMHADRTSRGPRLPSRPVPHDGPGIRHAPRQRRPARRQERAHARRQRDRRPTLAAMRDARPPASAVRASRRHTSGALPGRCDDPVRGPSPGWILGTRSTSRARPADRTRSCSTGRARRARSSRRSSRSIPAVHPSRAYFARWNPAPPPTTRGE